MLQLRPRIPSAWGGAVLGPDVRNIHINRNNNILIDLNGNVLDVKYVNCKTIYWIFVYKTLRQPW